MIAPGLGPALRIAWREGRAGGGKFFFVIAAVAVGVASITGVRGFSQAFRGMLLGEARTLMAADMTVRVFERPSAAQEAAMAELERRGARRTRITETVTMISAGAGDPVLVSVKAVDPRVYPFYGQIRLRPETPLASALGPDTVAVSEDLLLRLGTQVGAAVRVGEREFRIAAVVAGEPDRMTGSLNVGPRLLIGREGLEASGIMAPGSRAAERFLFQLPAAGLGVAEARTILKRAFPEGMIADYRETHPLITRGLDRATTFLTLVSLVALIVGALGVATAIHSHLNQRMDSIAVMKCLGATSGQLMRIYVAQTLMLGLAGSIAGVLLGLGVQLAFPPLVARYFPSAPPVRLDWLSSAQGIAAGILTTLLFTWPPLEGIRRIRPAAILRRDLPETMPGWSRRWREWRGAARSGALILCGIALVAASFSAGPAADSARLGAWFAGALAVSILLLLGFGKLLLSGLKTALARAPLRLPPTVRHGLGNLHRPGNHAAFVLAALGVGVMFTLTIFLVQRSMLDQLMRSAPPGMPNVFLINITERIRPGLMELLAAQRGVERAPEIVAAVPARLEAVNSVPVARIRAGEHNEHMRRFLRTRSVTWTAEPPPHTTLLSGQWWHGKPGEALLAVNEEAAAILGVKTGARLDFSSAGRAISARVACIYRPETIRPGSNVEFVFAPGALDGLPSIFYGSMRVRASEVTALQRAVYGKFPTVTVVNAADVLEIVQGVVDQIAIVIRFVSLFAVLAGAVVLASSVAGTRFRRVREIAILKALGATRARVAGIFSLEFAILGGLAGLVGSLFASAFSWLLLKRFFDASPGFDPLPNLAAVALTALLATAAGWAAGYRYVTQKPLAVLRQE
jgi:putative ABC transport system permease protein